MKKREMTKIALMGLASGLLVASQANAVEVESNTINQEILAVANCSSCRAASREYNSNSQTSDNTTIDSSNMNTRSDVVSDDAFKAQLNDTSLALYNSFDTEGKALARKLAAQPNYTDKNQAVKDAALKINAQKPKH